MRVVLILIVCLFFSKSSAQPVIKTFYDENGAETDSTNAYSYSLRVLGLGRNSTVSSFYSKSGKSKIKEEYDLDGNKVRTYYYESGGIMATGVFIGENPQGLLHSFYRNGGQQSELLFEPVSAPGKEPAMGIINYFDSLGNHLVINGNGFCDCNLNPLSSYTDRQRGQVVDGLMQGKWEGGGSISGDPYSFVDMYDHGNLLKGAMTYKGDVFTYTQIEAQTLPKGGFSTFYNLVSKRISYPTRARRKGIEGNVYVQFVIDKDGSLQDARVIKGIDPDCDAEALNAVKSSLRWNPGTYRGRPVKQRMTLPISFKLR